MNVRAEAAMKTDTNISEVVVTWIHVDAGDSAIG